MMIVVVPSGLTMQLLLIPRGIPIALTLAMHFLYMKIFQVVLIWLPVTTMQMPLKMMVLVNMQKIIMIVMEIVYMKLMNVGYVQVLGPHVIYILMLI